VGVIFLGGLPVTIGVALGPTNDAVAAGAPCNTNQTLTATPDASLDNLFQTYGNNASGKTWTGGDGTESVALPDGRELWLFSDTLLGKVTNGVRIGAGDVPYIHNSLVVENDGVLTKTYYIHRTTRPTAYVNLRPKYPFQLAFWPGATVVNGETVQVVGSEQEFPRHGQFFTVGDYLATFALPRLKLIRLHALPWSGIDWSDGTLSDEGYTYLYGSSGADVYAARVAGTDLTSPWTYYDGSGWTNDLSAALPIEQIPTESHFSVSNVEGTYVFVARSSVFSGDIVGAFGCSPVGPFGPTQDIYDPPEPAQYPASAGVVTYGAHAHPELSTSPNSLVVSYDVNPRGANGIENRDSSIYRPRFIDVTVSP